jgi:hypothetical protein
MLPLVHHFRLQETSQLIHQSVIFAIIVISVKSNFIAVALENRGGELTAKATPKEGEETVQIVWVMIVSEANIDGKRGTHLN